MSFTYLGKNSDLPSEPDRSILEAVPDPHPTQTYLARYTAPEFTSLCPVTGQPDFAHLVLDYVPKAHLIESKSFKLYLGSYRNHGAFHEACTIQIALDVQAVVVPHWIRISGYWYPRGGIPIDVFWQSDPPPDGLYLPPIGVAPYRGRG